MKTHRKFSITCLVIAAGLLTLSYYLDVKYLVFLFTISIILGVFGARFFHES
jgi:hypothetical protein